MECTATLRFRLPEQREDHQLAMEGWRWKRVVEVLDQHLRTKIKYSDASNEQIAAYADARRLLTEELDDEGLVLD